MYYKWFHYLYKINYSGRIYNIVLLERTIIMLTQCNLLVIAKFLVLLGLLTINRCMSFSYNDELPNINTELDID